MTTTVHPSATVEATPLIGHLIELRRRLVISVLAIAAGSAVAWLLYPMILETLVAPYCQANSGDCRLLVTDPLEGFAVRIKIAGYGGVALAMPVVLWQVWQFVAPGLYAKEKRYAVPFVAAGVALFALGAGLAYWTLPRALEFLIAVGGDDLVQFFSPGRYLSLVTFMMIAFGIGFQLPLIVTAAQLVGLVSNQKLRSVRRYVLVAIVLVVAIVTPSSDPYSLLTLAVPMYVSYELALLVGRFARR